MEVSDSETIKNVAAISANNDAELGSLIADAIDAIGNDGLIHVEEATGSETSIEFTEGLKVDRGYVSSNFVTNQQKMVAEFDNPLILCYEGSFARECFGRWKVYCNNGKVCCR
jgi:chaperonin GroEL